MPRIGKSARMRLTSYVSMGWAMFMSARLEPGRNGIHQRLAQPGMFDAFDRLAEKRPDQQGFSLGLRNAARHQVEFQVVVERAGRGAVAALHVVGKNLELRLV